MAGESQAAEFFEIPQAVPRPLELVAREEFQFVWRSLRRLGVWPDDVLDDAAQRVFEIATRKWHQVQPGKERAYLYRIGVFVAAEKRRRRQVELREQPDSDLLDRSCSEGNAPDELFERRRSRQQLDEVLETLPFALREVFMLYEFERLSLAEIAELVDIKIGTVSSRLRRARALFQKAMARLRQKLHSQGEFP